MNLLIVSAIFGIIGGIGLVIGIGTGIGRGRRGLPRGRTLLMAAFYPLLVFPVAGISVFALLSLSNIHLWDPAEPDATLSALFAFTIAGLIAAVPSTAAAFFAHVMSWNRHHAKQLGNPPSTP